MSRFQMPDNVFQCRLDWFHAKRVSFYIAPPASRVGDDEKKFLVTRDVLVVLNKKNLNALCRSCFPEA